MKWALHLFFSDEKPEAEKHCHSPKVMQLTRDGVDIPTQALDSIVHYLQQETILLSN